MSTKAKMVKPRKASRQELAVEAQFSGLRSLIKDYTAVAVAESWKGGGDPADVEMLELQLKLAWVKLHAHIEKMQRYWT
jgi:hypothetical protein